MTTDPRLERALDALMHDIHLDEPGTERAYEFERSAPAPYLICPNCRWYRNKNAACPVCGAFPIVSTARPLDVADAANAASDDWQRLHGDVEPQETA